MHRRTLFVALLAAAPLSACGTHDLAVTGPERSPAAPTAHHTGNNCVNFNVPPLGAVFGAPAANPPGTVVWVENGIPVSVNRFLLSNGMWAYNSLTIALAPAGFSLASGKTGRTNNINTGYDFTGLGFAVTYVKFHALRQGGYENLSVNGSPIFVGPLTAHPAALAGITISSSWAPVVGGVEGSVALTGTAANPIKKLLVGGQEFWLDTVCAYP